MKSKRFDIGFDFILLLAIFYLIDTQNLFFLALFAAIIHELGHILAIWLCGAYIERIELRAYGAHIALASYPILSYKREVFVALAGPLAGFLAAFLLSMIKNDTCALIAGFSFVLSVFNLLPAAPLDGGRILKFASLMFFDSAWQVRISMCGNILSALTLVLLCIYVNINVGVSPSLCIFCTFVAASFIKERTA